MCSKFHCNPYKNAPKTFWHKPTNKPTTQWLQLYTLTLLLSKLVSFCQSIKTCVLVFKKAFAFCLKTFSFICYTFFTMLFSGKSSQCFLPTVLPSNDYCLMSRVYLSVLSLQVDISAPCERHIYISKLFISYLDITRFEWQWRLPLHYIWTSVCRYVVLSDTEISCLIQQLVLVHLAYLVTHECFGNKFQLTEAICFTNILLIKIFKCLCNCWTKNKMYSPSLARKSKS